MDQTLYFALFVGALVLFVFTTIVHRPATRPCPACGEPTPIQARRCPYCEYLFSQA